MDESPPITHVIWDLDGLLIDTESVYTEANAQAMAKYGKKYTLELKVMTMGMKHDVSVARVLKKVGLSDTVTVEEYSVLYDHLLREMLPDCEMMPGAMRLVRHFAKHNIPMAICTGSCTFEYELKVQKHKELTDLIPLRVLTGDDPAVVHGKPAPDGFLVTMSRFEKKPAAAKHVLVFEDSPNGVRSAIAAGMQVVMIPDWNYSKPPEEVMDRISAVLDSLEDFRPETMGLPPLE
uniref:Haloacid dehalogenase-like hydrolase domain-containing protein 1 n=1 Tax=Ascaris suum TaxID=6253 RepID=F1L7X0_ASCSU